MLARSLGLLAATVAATNAILLPPSISSATTNIDNELAALGIVDPETQVINIPSGKCVGRDGDCSLVLEFSTGKQPKTLQLNGVPLYTSDPSVTSNPMNTPLMIQQLDSQESLEDFVAKPNALSGAPLRLTGSAFESGPVEFQSEEGEQLIPMNFQIYTLDGVAVNAPRVTLKVLKSTIGDLMVLSIAVGPVTPMANPENKICADWPMVCQWRDYLVGKANAAKQGIRKLCGGGPGGAAPGVAHKFGPPVRLPHHRHGGPPSPDAMAHGDGPMPHHHPHGAHPHGMHRPHSHYHHGGFSIANIVVMLVGAILMLMVTWILGYVIGTIVGYCIVGLWLLYRRAKGTPRYQRIAIDEQDVKDDEETPSAEAVPAEDPPAYEEKEVVV